MTTPKTIDQVRDEMAEDYTNLKYGNYNDTTINAFKAGFDASTKYHEADRDRLADENKRLREVLEFYADKENHEIRHVSEGIGPDPFIYRDGGKIAREALGNETIKKETI